MNVKELWQTISSDDEKIIIARCDDEAETISIIKLHGNRNDQYETLLAIDNLVTEHNKILLEVGLPGYRESVSNVPKKGERE